MLSLLSSHSCRGQELKQAPTAHATAATQGGLASGCARQPGREQDLKLQRTTQQSTTHV